MPPANLYDDGWRQGSLIRATLQADVIDHDGEIVIVEEDHGLWLLATQDCDLANTKINSPDKKFELRPVYDKGPADHVTGIRSKTAKVTNDLVLRADSPRVVITARALTALKDTREEEVLGEIRRREIKTWLGLRYDRPAVPTAFVPLAQQATALMSPFPENLEEKIRDVLVYYHDASNVNLFAVIADAADKADVTDWIDDIVAKLADQHGVTVKRRDVEPSSRTPLSVIETHYSLFSDEHSLSAGGP